MTETNHDLPKYDHLLKEPISEEDARAFATCVDNLIQHPELMDAVDDDVGAQKETWEKILCRISKIAFYRKQALS